MKKDTVYGWITRQRDQMTPRKETNEALRQARLAALWQCENWLFSLTWAQMRAPVPKKREDIATEALPLITKKQENPASLSEQETTRLDELVASDAIYGQFEKKITPTARQAQIEVEMRQCEQERQMTFLQRRKER